MRVLVIDHDLRTARRFARMLEEDGHVVDVVEDAPAALARMDEARVPDVLVIDGWPAGASGAAVIARARATRPGLHVVVVTDRPERLGVAEVGEPQPVVLTKPISYGEFHSWLGRIASDLQPAGE